MCTSTRSIPSRSYKPHNYHIQNIRLRIFPPPIYRTARSDSLVSPGDREELAGDAEARSPHQAQSLNILQTRFFFFFFFHLTYSRWTSSLPSCLWSQRIFPSLPGSRHTFFLSRCKFSTLTTRQPMVEFYLLTFPRFPLRKKEHRSYFGKNRTHDFRTNRCAAYLLDHSGDKRHYPRETPILTPCTILTRCTIAVTWHGKIWRRKHITTAYTSPLAR